MRSVLAILVLVCLGGVATAGPIRNWIENHRPGIIIPKRSYNPQPIGPIYVQPGCPNCPTCPGGTCPAPIQPEVIKGFHALPFGPVQIVPLTGCPCGPGCGCPGGVCPTCPKR